MLCYLYLLFGTPPSLVIVRIVLVHYCELSCLVCVCIFLCLVIVIYVLLDLPVLTPILCSRLLLFCLRPLVLYLMISICHSVS